MLAAAMLLVISARNAVLFLCAWEAMSLASFFLVMTEHEKEHVRRAGWLYLVATHLGTACLLALFLLLGQGSSSLDFANFASSPRAAGVLFVLALVGFGAKAGFVPFHVWLPEAHPAAPSHVSAVMSGVMIKTGIYGLLRTLTFLGEVPAWWGWTLVALGVTSALFGVLFALAQRDLKRVLAYSSVENMGLIALGLGVGLLGIAYERPTMAALGLLAALLHVLNHALFKTLLFLGAGAVQHQTGTRDLNQLGGLLRRMPVSGGSFLVGACAISGLPPLNGFLSEVLILFGLLTGVTQTGPGERVAWNVLCVLVVGGLALVGGLAVVCFTRAFGSVFLGEPRSAAAEQGSEVGAAMRSAQLLLAGACVLVAVAAPLWPYVYRPAIAELIPIDSRATSVAALVQARGPLVACSLMLAAVVALVTLFVFLRSRLLAGRTVAYGPTWDCGYVLPGPRMQYTGSSYSAPLANLFRIVLRSRQQVEMPADDFPARATLRTETPDVCIEALFQPVFLGVAWLASKLRWLQQGRIQLYVLYIALTILLLLVWKLD
jgi:formate hydrogenlyase subunit 3/multisubunit Na+/H+ antiporter MnhD subunit